MDSAYNTIFYIFQTFADKMMGVAAFIMPLLVATSALGSLSCHIMTSSRLCFVGARQGHFPDFLSLITIDKNLPKPSLIFLVSFYCQWYKYLNDNTLHKVHLEKKWKNSYNPSFQGILSIIYLFVGDIYALINYASFVESSFILLSVLGLLYLRWKKPEMNRPIKVRYFIS